MLFSNHEASGIRTPDNLIKSQVLYHLSYTPLFLSQGKCPEPESNQWHEDFQSSALPTELSGHTHNILCELRGQDLNLRPSGYEPDELPDCSTPRYEINGWRWIRTTEAICSRFTVCPLWPLGNPPIWSFTVFQQTSFRLTVWCKPMIGLEPITCWLQISCSANWATSAYL